MKHDFEERKQRRIENAIARAAKADKESTQRHETARQIGSFIPMGQPIMVGHHSEKRHRRDLEKIDNNMRKSVELSNKAEYYRGKAESIEANAEYVISSDDPEALPKLRAKLEAMQARQELWKASNKAIRKFHDKPDKQIEALKELGFSDQSIVKLLTPGFGGIGFPSYKTTNNNANMRTVKLRIEQLERVSTLETKETVIPGTENIKVIQNVEANRIQIKFPGKPDESVRKELKSRGFRWAPSEGAWQRHLNGNGMFQLKYVIEFLTPKTA